MRVVVKIVGLTLLGSLGIVTVIGLLLPRQWYVAESIVIQAPPERIHLWVEDFHKWSKWAFWSDKDPTLVHEFLGAQKGVGAEQHYHGSATGSGTLTITQSDPARGVWWDERIESADVNAHGSITYEVRGSATRVTWTDSGRTPPVIGGFFISMIQDSLRAHFKEALLRLQALAVQPEKTVADPGAGTR